MSYSFANVNTTRPLQMWVASVINFQWQHCCHKFRPDLNVPPNSLHCLPSSSIWITYCTVKHALTIQYASYIHTALDHLTLVLHIIIYIAQYSFSLAYSYSVACCIEKMHRWVSLISTALSSILQHWTDAESAPFPNSPVQLLGGQICQGHTLFWLRHGHTRQVSPRI